jgi:hypothetical protein
MAANRHDAHTAAMPAIPGNRIEMALSNIDYDSISRLNYSRLVIRFQIDEHIYMKRIFENLNRKCA